MDKEQAAAVVEMYFPDGLASGFLLELPDGRQRAITLPPAPDRRDVFADGSAREIFAEFADLFRPEVAREVMIAARLEDMTAMEWIGTTLQARFLDLIDEVAKMPATRRAAH